MKESYISDLYVFEEKGKPGQREEQVQVKKGRGIRGDLHFEDPDAPVSICTCFVKEWMKLLTPTALSSALTKIRDLKQIYGLRRRASRLVFKKECRSDAAKQALRSGGGRAGAFRSVQECRKDFPAF